MDGHIPADNGGLRFNDGKMERHDLVPPEFEGAIATHFGQGAKKYAARNWERGMAWSKCYASARRHLRKWWAGESFDVEDPKMPGYHAHHLIALAWNAIVLYCYETRNIGEDDRVIAERGMYADVFKFAPPALPEPPKPFTYWYVATPYTRFPAGLQAAHIMACRVTSDLIKHAIPAYSPIAHTHPIAEYGQMDKVDHNLWVAVDKPLLECASGLFVVKAESWEESKGVAHEIAEFEAAGKPVIYWDPATWLPINDLVAAMHHDD